MDGSFGNSLLLFNSAILFLLSLTALTMAEPYYISKLCRNTVGNYTANSTYQANLNTLRSSMSSYSTLHNGFYNNTVGQDSDKVYGIFLCRGAVTSDKCRDCVNTSIHQIIEQCPNQKEAIIWYLECMLRYSNRSIFATMEISPFSIWGNPNDIRSEVKSNFTRALGGLMNSLVNRVAATGSSSSSIPLFGTGERFYTGFERVYGLVQCTPDISGRDCRRCLQTSISDLPLCCDGKVGGGIHRPSCSLRYSTSAFYELTNIAPAPLTTFPAPPPPPANTTITIGKKTISTEIIIIVILVCTVFVLILLSIICFIWWRMIPKEKVNDPFCEDEDVILSSESLQFDFGTISAATDDFSDANKLGEGGFGVVFKGKLSNGQEIAVKRLCSNSGQGDLEFKNEVVLVAKLQHRNLVRLLGFCLEGEEKLLIYEFVPNASLDYFIFDPVKRSQLDWERRYRIIGGITRGLLYLHEDSRLKIIHRDLKASNILLDQDMNPKIADFGMARLFVVDQTRANTKRVVGTFGYMAPEYAIQGQFSVKSDVFSFGVLLLEIVSGKKSTSFSENAGNLLSYAWGMWREGAAMEFTDPTLREWLSISEVKRCIHIGLLCVQERAEERPTMASVVLMLNSYAVPLPLPSEPAFYLHSGTEPNTHMGEYNSHEGELEDSTNQSAVFSINEVSISELSPR